MSRIEVAPPLLNAGANEARVCLFEREPEFRVVLLEQCVTRGGKLFVRADLFFQGEVFDAALPAFFHAFEFAEFFRVAADADPADDGRDAEDGLLRRTCSAPAHTLINPRAQQADLLRGERLALAGRRHLHVLDEASDVVNEAALRAVAGDDVVGVIVTAFEG